ncbi:MAG: DUF421 domain-containing protein [Actinobacteria bacterium]|nr:DUF421 domain-containing protein [Actinomycetota bacterium]
MSRWLVGPLGSLGFVALTAALMYLSTVLALRVGERRTIAEMSAFDFVVAVAIGAIVGRTVTSAEPTYLQGMTAIVTLLVTHHVVGILRRRFPAVRRAVEERPVVVVTDGRVHERAVAAVDLTMEDLAAKLRQRGIPRLEEVELAVLESDGRVSVITRGAEPVGDLLWRGLDRPADAGPRGQAR